MKRWVAWPLVVVFAGCSSLFAPARDPSRFFALSVEANGARDFGGMSVGAKTVGLGPVRLPDYLDRNELCTRVSTAELRFSERNRWAAPLRTSVPTILAQNLAIALQGARVVSYPWTIGEPIDVQVEVDVQRFEPDAGGKATLVARWTIRDGERNVLKSRETTHSRDGGADTAARVTALSETLADLAKEIAGAFEVSSPSPAASRRPLPKGER